MRVLFLDIDGVLNNDCCFDERPLEHSDMLTRLDLTCCALLNDVLAATGAQIVLSSDWRYSVPRDIDMESLLRRRGVICAEIVGRTPNIVRSSQHDPGRALAWIVQQLNAGKEWRELESDDCPWVDRGDEIRAWLESAEHRIDAFALVDDEQVLRVGDRLVRTDARFGLTRKDADRLIAMLNESQIASDSNGAV